MKWLLAAASVALPALAHAQTPGPLPGQPPSQPTQLPQVDVVAPTPLLGSGIDRRAVPAQAQVLTGKDLSLEGPPNATAALENQAQGVHLDNAAGNPFQPDLFYHGFEASPLQGTPQGIAVYLDGARFNDPFGDTVNWDLIPDLAIDRIDLVGANPVFGLNALGGALNVRLKDGFTYHGGELDLYGGSFGQAAADLQYGRRSGNTAAYVAASGLHEDGWRDDQSSTLKKFYGDLGWRGPQAELHISVDLAQTNLNGPGTVPIELLDANPRAQFTGPNEIDNNYARINARGTYDLTDTTSFQALAYYDNLRQTVINGNASPLTACGTLLCDQTGAVATDRQGGPIVAFLGPNGSYGSLATQTTNSNGYGAAWQLTNADDLFNHTNQFVAGLSYDGATTLFDANTQSGGLDPTTRNFTGPGTLIDLADGSIAPVRAGITDAYYGAYFTDSFNLTPKLAATISGRFNAADIALEDLGGGTLTGTHVYNRFNPAAGLTYKLTPTITLYAGYAESNRAPTPAELTCSSPASPCSLANFFSGDPDLKQVVAHSWEAGLRGQLTPADSTRLAWNLGAFRSDLSDDISFAQSSVLGTGYFQNIGDTRRQGIDAGIRYTTNRLLAWINYSYTDATFQNSFTEQSPNNPAADSNGNIEVHPGNRLPGIPAHLLKAGVSYKATEKWTIGATALAASGQYLFGDEANLTEKLPAYVRLDLNTSYQLLEHLQLFALLQNALDARYDSYGTFSPTTGITRSVNIAAPIGAFGGVKVAF